MFKRLTLKDQILELQRENAKLKANVGEPKETQIEDIEGIEGIEVEARPKLFEQVETLDEIIDTIFGGM